MLQQRRKQAEAAALRTANENRNAGKPSRSNSPVKSQGRAAERPRPSKFEGGGRERPQPSGRGDSHGRSKREKDVQVTVPTTNDNLATFEQSFEIIPAQKRLRSCGLPPPKEAGSRRNSRIIQRLPSWLRASRRFIAFAHRGRLVAVSQASPFVYWETLAADEESRSRVLREILEPFLKNADLVKAMFAAGSTPPTAPPKNLTAEAVKENTSAGDDEDPADATTATSPHIDGSGIGKGSREQEEGMDDAWLQPPPPTTTAATASGVESQHPGSCPSVENEEQPGIRSWGYLSSLAARGGWKVDAAEIARRDDSVELKFDSIAFDVFVRTGDRGSERRTATEGITGTAFSPRTPARPSRTNNCRAESASREDDDDDDDHHDASTVPSAIVTNAVPFRLAQGLPRELGPLLFDANIDADILAGKNIDPSPSEKEKSDSPAKKSTADDPSSPKRGKMDSSSPKTDALELNPQEQQQEEEEEEEEGEGFGLGQGWGGREIWTRKADPLGTGEVFSHISRGEQSDDDVVGAIEVRLRAGPLGVAELARAGLPKDVSALVVGVDGGDTGDGKGVGGSGSGGASGVGATGGKAGTSRTH
eukprot:jgi/Undpi1/10704/HiC_scaffold_29.g13152.m1